MSEPFVTVPLPQWLAEEALAVLRATRDLPGVAAQVGDRLGCEEGFVGDVVAHLERVLAPFPLPSLLAGKLRFFCPRGGRVPDDVVFLFRQTRPGRVNYQPVRPGSGMRSMPEQVFFESHEELSRAEYLAATQGRGS